MAGQVELQPARFKQYVAVVGLQCLADLPPEIRSEDCSAESFQQLYWAES